MDVSGSAVFTVGPTSVDITAETAYPARRRDGCRTGHRVGIVRRNNMRNCQSSMEISCVLETPPRRTINLSSLEDFIV